MLSVRGISFALLFMFSALTIYIMYGVHRADTTALMISYTCLFLLYLWIVKNESTTGFWIIGAMGVRLCLIFAIPNLSDDFYRFIWDGRVWEAGGHPFATLPSALVNEHISGLDQVLFQKLNSPDYFTVYPPLSQLIFWLSVKLFPDSITGSVFFMRLLIIAAEGASMLLLVKLLDLSALPRKNALLYALNPLVILELTGNLHFEAFVIFFLLLGIWLLRKGRIIPAGIGFAMAIGIKLLPVIFLPLIGGSLEWKKAVLIYGTTAVCVFIFFLPLYDPGAFMGFSESLNLYFQKFEFNASLYYMVREYGFWKYGYNTIQTTGWKMGFVGAILILILAVATKLKSGTGEKIHVENLCTGFLFTLMIYLLFTTTVHPWYIIPMIAFATLNSFRFPIVWSALVFSTYAGYSLVGYKENLTLTIMEYIFVFGYLGYELIWRRKRFYLFGPS